uniref:pentapeptide repeat-containing protein n=1 Tax=Paenibacillus xylaniclasticus TaxID=588083 RepID=UPI000FD8F3D8
MNKPRFHHTRITKIHFFYYRFIKRSFYNLSTLQKCLLTNTDFYYSNLASINFLEVSMNGVVLTKSNLDYSIFKKCEATNSTLIQAHPVVLHQC